MVSVHHDVIDLIFGNSIWTLRRSLSLGPFNIGAIPIDKLDIEVRNPVRLVYRTGLPFPENDLFRNFTPSR